MSGVDHINGGHHLDLSIGRVGRLSQLSYPILGR